MDMSVVVKSAWLNMLLQVCFRAGTFLGNAIMLRYISRELLGLVNVRLLLLYSTIVFLSRESFRKSCLSKTDSEKTLKGSKMQLVNLIWLSVVAGIVLSFLFCIIWIILLEQPSTQYLKQYQTSCICFACSAIIELTIEPMWIFGQKSGYITSKVVLEGIFLIVRSVLSVLVVILMPKYALYGIAISYLTASIVYAALYFCFFFKVIYSKHNSSGFSNIRDIFPNLVADPFLDQVSASLVKSFFKQSLLKQFLTEGERYVMTLFRVLSLSQQGVYDVINNLGSLAARFIFMPIEESYYVYFSQTLERNVKKYPDSIMKQCCTSLSVVLKFVSLISFIILVFGYGYSYLLLDLYGGEILSNGEGPNLLRTYCIYVMFIALNGITECFMFASMNQQQIDSYNFKMLLFSIVFLLSSLLFTKYLGGMGFILANCLNMGMRISQSALFIQDFFSETSYRPLKAIIPSIQVFFMLLVSLLFTAISEKRYFEYPVVHVGVGCTCLLGVLASIYFTEHEFIDFVKELLKKKKIK
ncbi:man(5)GlcNAc(2)-PP-dolichol translocation protein RFT1 [Hydra vulgaris]|uniref:Protein RFT1 homolog n=1 Tax=Hydra vulgaris TaxID=6087 RepID=A0ABM4CWC5_HYDVU